MEREKKLVDAIIVVSTALIAVLRIVWDFLPRQLVRNALQEVKNSLQLVDSSYTVTILSDIDRIEKSIKEGAERNGR